MLDDIKNRYEEKTRGSDHNSMELQVRIYSMISENLISISNSHVKYELISGMEN